MLTQLRDAVSADAQAIAVLLEQLGYPTDASQVVDRLRRLRAWPEARVVVACRKEVVVGMMQLQRVPGLAEPDYLEVRSLVVEQRARGEGVGAMLLAEARRAVSEAGQLRIRCNVIRTDAHRFYQREGLRVLKSQTLFGWGAR
ncbi:GNAT family N-acetyltransferase [Motiliproteus sediminis]|uniref:GNAT family N-acetyltransferase n=1 Tax=Motiliproteus sediminis TaxID=1468178 RepID=UPI001AEFB919|nr:GNAT family N-acetyltransferase [Motiliproteus sediminis]